MLHRRRPANQSEETTGVRNHPDPIGASGPAPTKDGAADAQASAGEQRAAKVTWSMLVLCGYIRPTPIRYNTVSVCLAVHVPVWISCPYTDCTSSRGHLAIDYICECVTELRCAELFTCCAGSAFVLL